MSLTKQEKTEYEEWVLLHSTRDTIHTLHLAIWMPIPISIPIPIPIQFNSIYQSSEKTFAALTSLA